MQTTRRVMRLDAMPMPRAYFTPEGFLKDKPVLTSTGIFEYTNPDGSIRRELRLPQDVFSPESLRSYKGKPVVVSHDAGLIDKDNVAENQIGTILSEGERSGDDVRAEIIIHDTDAMKSAGFKELSLGYNLDLDETPGEWQGQRYDAVQKNIRINHLALVKEARAGEQARLNMDSRDNANVLKGGKRMSKKIVRTRHGDAVLSDEEFAKAIDEYKRRKAAREKTDADDVVEEEVEVEKAEPNDIEAKVEAVKARRDRRDEEGDPKDMEESMSVIAHQDEDLDILFDIIDTLLAKQDFDAAEEEPVEEEEVLEEEKEDGEVDDLEKLKGDAEEEEEPVEEEELAEDAEEEELPEEEIPEEDEELAEDAEDEEFPTEDEEIPEEDEDLQTDSCEKAKRMDSAASRAIRTHMIMGKLGRQVGLKNLEFKDVRDAKIAIIKAVRPEMRLDGKSEAYINGAFDNAKKSIKARRAKGVNYQKRQMFNSDSRESKRVEKNSAADARNRMIERLNNK